MPQEQPLGPAQAQQLEGLRAENAEFVRLLSEASRADELAGSGGAAALASRPPLRAGDRGRIALTADAERAAGSFRKSTCINWGDRTHTVERARRDGMYTRRGRRRVYRRQELQRIDGLDGERARRTRARDASRGGRDDPRGGQNRSRTNKWRREPGRRTIMITYTYTQKCNGKMHKSH